MDHAGAVASAVHSTAIESRRIAGSEIELSELKVLAVQRLVLLVGIAVATTSGVSLQCLYYCLFCVDSSDGTAAKPSAVGVASMRLFIVRRCSFHIDYLHCNGWPLPRNSPVGCGTSCLWDGLQWLPS